MVGAADQRELTGGSSRTCFAVDVGIGASVNYRGTGFDAARGGSGGGEMEPIEGKGDSRDDVVSCAEVGFGRVQLKPALSEKEVCNSPIPPIAI